MGILRPLEQKTSPCGNMPFAGIDKKTQAMLNKAFKELSSIFFGLWD